MEYEQYNHPLHHEEISCKIQKSCLWCKYYFSLPDITYIFNIDGFCIYPDDKIEARHVSENHICYNFKKDNLYKENVKKLFLRNRKPNFNFVLKSIKILHFLLKYKLLRFVKWT